VTNWLKRLLPKSKFARGVGVLVGGTAGAQALGVLAAPILTRLYSPDDFGLLAVYASLLALCGVIASLRYELAIPLPEDDEQAAHLVVLSGLLVLGTTTLVAILVWLAGDPLAEALGAPRLAPYLWLLPVGILLSGTYSVFRYWAIRTQSFGAVARTTVWQSLSTLLIQIAGFKFGAVSLLVGQAGGQGVGTLSLGTLFSQSAKLKRCTWRAICQQASRYKRFPIFSTWEGLFNTAGTQLPPLLFAILFSPAAAGLYSLANRVLSLPMSLIGGAIGQVFFANAAQAHREGRLGQLVAQLHSKLAHVGLPPALLLILAGPELFAWVFGAEWRQAGEFARWMAPWLYLVFVSSPLSTLFAVMEQQKQGLAFQVILLTARLVALYAGATTGDLLSTVILFSTASAVCWLGFVLWIGYKTGNPIRVMMKPTLEAAIYALVCGLPLAAILLINPSIAHAWLYGLLVSVALVAVRILHLLRKAY